MVQGDLRLSGLLRLRHEETAKTIYFEEGAPVFAASDLPEEQLEYRLPLDEIASTELIDEARRRSLTPHELGCQRRRVAYESAIGNGSHG